MTSHTTTTENILEEAVEQIPLPKQWEVRECDFTLGLMVVTASQGGDTGTLPRFLKFLNVCPFDYTAFAVSGTVGYP